MSPWRWLFRAKVRVLRLRPGDVVVLESPRPLSPAQAETVKRQWEKRFPNLPVAVVSELRVAAVGPAEPPSPTRPDPGVPDKAGVRPPSRPEGAS